MTSNSNLLTDAVIEIKRELHTSCRVLERYGICTYRNAEISCIIPRFRVMAVKPKGAGTGDDEILILPLHDIPSKLITAQLHAELYGRLTGVTSILSVSSEWISIAAGVGRPLDPLTYGYVPSFTETVPCTSKIGVASDSPDYPKAAADRICDIFSGTPSQSAVLLRSQGAIVFADSPMDAAEFAITLEYAAKKTFYIHKFK